MKNLIAKIQELETQRDDLKFSLERTSPRDIREKTENPQHYSDEYFQQKADKQRKQLKLQIDQVSNELKPILSQAKDHISKLRFDKFSVTSGLPIKKNMAEKLGCSVDYLDRNGIQDDIDFKKMLKASQPAERVKEIEQDIEKLEQVISSCNQERTASTIAHLKMFS